MRIKLERRLVSSLAGADECSFPQYRFWNDGSWYFALLGKRNGKRVIVRSGGSVPDMWKMSYLR